MLEEEQARYGFRLEAVNVDSTPELAQRYGEQVPVVVVNGKVRFWGRINSVLVERFLQAETNRPVD
jgi:hypothetical protein